MAKQEAPQDNTINNAGKVGDNKSESVDRVAAGDSPDKAQQGTTKEQEPDLKPIDMFTILFGTFTIVVILVTAVANDQSQTANQLALLSLCTSNSVRCLGLETDNVINTET